MEGNKYLIFNKEQWQAERECKVFGFDWSDEEIDKAINGDGLIGSKWGVDCYVPKFLQIIS